VESEAPGCPGGEGLGFLPCPGWGGGEEAARVIFLIFCALFQGQNLERILMMNEIEKYFKEPLALL